MGKTPSRNNLSYWGSKDNQWISIADLSKSGKYIEETKEYLSDRAVEESGISVIPANTVVMSFKLSIGKTAITPKSMYSNEAIMAFCDKKVTELLPDYIYYMFLRRKWESGTNKAVMGNTLNKSTLSNIKVKIHKIDKQREIVKILDCASQIIDDREKQLHELDALVKARFVEMF
ncbi:restriction endonuclease subunit S, partial [Alloscardovia omnicolens]